MTWKTVVTGSGLKGRVLAAEYLNARGQAFECSENMDPVLQLELSPTRQPRGSRGEEVHLRLILGLAFMAGSSWERRYRGRRYNDELTC